MRRDKTTLYRVQREQVVEERNGARGVGYSPTRVYGAPASLF
jgi:hypothetical protein